VPLNDKLVGEAESGPVMGVGWVSGVVAWASGAVVTGPPQLARAIALTAADVRTLLRKKFGNADHLWKWGNKANYLT
jgi:hypothetical protein